MRSSKIQSSSPSRFKKSVTFHQNHSKQSQQLETGLSTQVSEFDQNTKSQFTRRKLFNVQNCKFMSMKNISSEGNQQQSYSFDPIIKLNQQIFKMEDILAKTQRSYVRKVKNIGKKYNRQCERQIKLAEQAMQLRNQLKKNLKCIMELKNMLGKQDIKSGRSLQKLSLHKRRYRHFHSPLHFHRQYHHH